MKNEIVNATSLFCNTMSKKSRITFAIFKNFIISLLKPN